MVRRFKDDTIYGIRVKYTDEGSGMVFARAHGRIVGSGKNKSAARWGATRSISQHQSGVVREDRGPRIFGGKKYQHYRTTTTKAAADKLVDKLKAQNYMHRVVTTHSLGVRHYSVYMRRRQGTTRRNEF